MKHLPIILLPCIMKWSGVEDLIPCDIIPCGFYFWSYLKFKVFVTPPRGMQDLRKRIQVEFENLRRTPGVMHNAVRSMEKV